MIEIDPKYHLSEAIFDRPSVTLVYMYQAAGSSQSPARRLCGYRLVGNGCYDLNGT